MQPTEAGPPIDFAQSEHPKSMQASPIELMQIAFEGNFPKVQYHFVQFFSEHLADCSVTFGGDLDQVALLAVLGQRYIDPARDAGADTMANDAKIWLSASRLAEITGIPRETVRRKLLLLAARGWAEQRPGKGWAVSTDAGRVKAGQDLQDLTARGLRRLARLAVALRPHMPLPDAAPRPGNSGPPAPDVAGGPGDGQ